MEINQENYYWLFSSSAQTIAAFVAFLITGYALVLNMMQNLEQKDDTYEDIHHQLKKGYYKKLVFLTIVTGLAILSSLGMIYLNGICYKQKIWLFSITSFLIVVSILSGIIFVISIINPNRYKNAAKEIIKEDKLKAGNANENVDQNAFMSEFISLEKNIRDILQKKQLYVPFGNTPKMVYSFRQMIEALNKNELIGYHDFLELLKVNKYRNLVFHGHLDKIDSEMLQKLKDTNEIVKKIP